MNVIVAEEEFVTHQRRHYVRIEGVHPEPGIGWKLTAKGWEHGKVDASEIVVTLEDRVAALEAQVEAQSGGSAG